MSVYSGLFTLLLKVILKVLRHLDDQENHSHFARVSQRSYALTMNFVIHHDVWYREGGLLSYGARRNLSGLPWTILHRDGDLYHIRD
jgi:hypothetical protein